jgi:hypothetical protein
MLLLGSVKIWNSISSNGLNERVEERSGRYITAKSNCQLTGGAFSSPPRGASNCLSSRCAIESSRWGRLHLGWIRDTTYARHVTRRGRQQRIEAELASFKPFFQNDTVDHSFPRLD